MVVWDAGSRVDGATQGGRLQLASLFHGTDHPTKEGKTTGSSSPAPRVRTCLPLHDTLASDRATQGFLTRSLSHHFLMSSDTFWQQSASSPRQRSVTFVADGRNSASLHYEVLNP